MSKGIDIAPMTIADYDEVIALWQGCDGIGLRDFEDSHKGRCQDLRLALGSQFHGQV